MLDLKCPICGDVRGNCADGVAPLTFPPFGEEPAEGDTVADQKEPKASFPRQEVKEGQKHGYIGDVEVTDPVEMGYSNVKSVSDKSDKMDKSVKGDKGTIKADES